MEETTTTFEMKPEPGDNGAPPLAPEGTAGTLEDTAFLLKEAEDARTKAAEYLDGWQRSQAEFANYKRRVERDREQTQQNLTAQVVKRYLEIIDDLERALKKRPQDNDGAAWADGIELIYRKFLGLLEAEGVKPMEALSQPFDPSRHEAILQEAVEGFHSGQITEVIQNGYTIGERVLRPALVRIAA